MIVTKIEYGDGNPNHRSVGRIVSTIVSVLDGQLARMPPGASSLIASVDA